MFDLSPLFPVLLPPLTDAGPIRQPHERELDGQLQRQLHEIDLREIHSGDRLARLDYRIRLRLLRQLVVRFVPAGGLVVDVGCASGNISLLLAALGFRVIAVDLRLDFVRYARLKRAGQDFIPVVCSGDALPFQRACADGLILGEILEHVAYPEAFLSEAARVVKPGGLLLVTTPNGAHRWSPLQTFSSAQHHREDYAPRQFGPDGGDHLFLYTMDELDGLMRGAGFHPSMALHFYSDVLARVVARIRSVPFWPHISTLLSPSAARLLALADWLILRMLSAKRVACALGVAATRGTDAGGQPRT